MKLSLYARATLESVVDRLESHVEYEKYQCVQDNLIDQRVLAKAKSLTSSVSHSDDFRHALSEATERLRLHTVLHPYNKGIRYDTECDVMEDDTDQSALCDAYELLEKEILWKA